MYRQELLMILLLFTACNSDVANNSLDKLKLNHWKGNLTKKESIELCSCLPENWIAWEEFDKNKKSSLAHVGIADFDLHIKANKSNRATSHTVFGPYCYAITYTPEVILHFFKSSEEVREAVDFTSINASIISSTNFARFFGETKKYLIYECETEIQNYMPADTNFKAVKECLSKKLNIEFEY
ncbi:hypothetical protein DNU06_10545 [Putridiphycobacter roseus]|uniref:Lipoprotein n=1 Tax=Putridiphycobacter roseus TaxID=2219161 RepID=A0A2W1NBJ3_9FLAO|nr:hypothetical protein [Putridiphycobacter roseus]PZE16695.1 hypothetical protein DNU06_10545 [Putridiphycobacter roseus]